MHIYIHSGVKKILVTEAEAEVEAGLRLRL
jgi:hypothetical protein